MKLSTEDEIQSTVVEGLTALGYTVLITSRRRKKCPFCHRTDTRGDGASKGVPDLLVGRKGWGAMWIGLEMKGTTTPLSEEQAKLFEAEMIFVARSWEDATRAINAFQNTHGLPGPRFQ